MSGLAGVDGCKHGWIAAVETERKVAIHHLTLDELFDDKQFSTVVIDVPIGLPDRGRRAADTEARKLLKRRACCIFTAPIRPILGCNTRAEATKVWWAIDQKKCTCQTFAIKDKIKVVDERMTARIQTRIWEGHPEVSFTEMNKEPIEFGKKNQSGRDARLRLLEPHFPGIFQWVADNQSCATDVIDAFAMLWTARRVGNGEAQRLPKSPEYDSRGLRMEIAY